MPKHVSDPSMAAEVPGQRRVSSFRATPHDVDSHWVFLNASASSTSRFAHQPRSWSKAEASWNIPCMLATLSTSQSLSGRLNAEAPRNISCISVTLDVSHALMSSLNVTAAAS